MHGSSSDTPHIDSPCAILHGVGKVLSEKLAKLDLHCVRDLLFHLPYQYQDRTRLTPIRQAKASAWLVIEAEVLQAQVVFGKRRSLRLTLGDGSGVCTMVLFYFNRSVQSRLAVGTFLRCFGQCTWGQRGVQMIHPEYQVIDPASAPPLDETLTPIYHTTEGLSQKTLRQCIQQAVEMMQDEQVTMPDYLPSAWLASHPFPPLKEAITQLHCPRPDDNTEVLLAGASPSHQRLVIEELAAHQLALIKKRQEVGVYSVPRLPAIHAYLDAFKSQLGFDLTGAQSRVIQAIEDDLAQTKPMMRLLQGDVGSGKTVVAAVAMLTMLERGQTVALMAPTELLAEQHRQSFEKWFAPLGIRVGYLSGQLTQKEKRAQLDDLATGQVRVMIGTHALFQKHVNFHNLSLIVIDEQHRFGVGQRLALWEKGVANGVCPHQLVMTATPIPRTIAMVAYADLDVSIIDEMPKGRQAIDTLLVSQQRREAIMDRVYAHCHEGQCYWVCTLINESEVLQCQAAESAFALLQSRFPDLSIALVHGMMSADEKNRVMNDFKAQKVACLVATTVIEVGVDVPNATLMVIENAERLGLSQLHQLRGRVGRGQLKSYCVLMYQPPLSVQGKARLALMRDTQDGFLIAQRDMEMRGPGELMGTRQTGLCQFQMVDLLRDENLLDVARDCAEYIVRYHPGLVPLLMARWIVDKAQYMMV